MAVNSTQQVSDSYTVVVLPEEDTTESHCESPVAVSNSLEDYVLIKSQLNITKMGGNAYPYSDCFEQYVDIENMNLETPKINEESVGSLKNEEGRMLLMNHNMILPKLSTRDKTGVEKVVVEVSRMRKYKRSASFNSRKVVLLFSVLSSLGTIILIYLTLRVKQIVDESIYST